MVLEKKKETIQTLFICLYKLMVSSCQAISILCLLHCAQSATASFKESTYLDNSSLSVSPQWYIRLGLLSSSLWRFIVSVSSASLLPSTRMLSIVSLNAAPVLANSILVSTPPTTTDAWATDAATTSATHRAARSAGRTLTAALRNTKSAASATLPSFSAEFTRRSAETLG